MKREGPRLVALITGLIVLGGHFFASAPLKAMSAEIVRWRIIVAAFALALGGFNMLRLHGKAISQRRKNWQYSIIFVVAFLAYFTLGVATSTTSVPYKYVWQNLYQPAASTMYSFTLFYMTSACWRAFRIRNWQAGVLMVTGAAVLLGQVGLGAAVSPMVPKFAAWVIAVPNAAAIRSITIGGSLGMVVMSIRVILGLERTYMTGGKD